MTEGKSRKTSNRVFFIILIVILVVINGILWYNNQQISKDKEDANLKLESAEALKAELEEEYKILEEQLAEYKGENETLDSMLQATKMKMESLKQEIEVLLRKDKITARDLAQARSRIEDLKAEHQAYMAKVDSLTTANKMLSQENETLEQRLDLEKQQTQKLETEKADLSQKVAIGSLLKTDEIMAMGVKFRSSGKEVTTSNAKKAQKIKVCFDILENKIADLGEKLFYIRIISPEGSTLAIQSRGSGTLTLAESGEQRQYTVKGATQYDRQRKRVCIYWDQDTPFSPGYYEVEIYQDGYEIGKSSFELKAGIL